MKFIKENKWKIFIAIIVLLSIFRIWLGYNIPLYYIADSKYDDYLLKSYTDSILCGNWLGNYNNLTLVKGVTYSLFLAVIAITRIPYALALTFINVIVALIFVKSIKPLIKNKYFLGILYLFLIFSPATLDKGLSQRLYRNALTVPFTLLILSGFIGMYLNILYENNKKSIIYGLLGGISLVLFQNLREDTIWIIPFCIVASIATVITLLIKYINKKNKKVFFKIFIMIIPWAIVILGNLFICLMNYNYYGVFTTNDRTDGSFADLISLMIKIDYEDDENVNSENCILSKDKLTYIIDNSESLSEHKDAILINYSGWANGNGDGENVNGDLFVWSFRDALASEGLFESAEKIDEFCNQVINELETKIDNDEIGLDSGISLSSSTKLFKFSDLPELLSKSFTSAKILNSYETAYTSFNESTGKNEEIREVERLTNSLLLESGESEETVKYNKVQEKCVEIANKIISIYQKISIPLCVISLILYVVITILQIPNIRKKDWRFFNIWLILTGIILTYVVLVVAVTFFATWISDYKSWPLFYTSGAVALMQIFELVVLYEFVHFIINKVKNK